MSRDGLDRREFLKRSALAGAGIGLLPVALSAAPEPPRPPRRVTLGRTGLEIPDIGFGGSRLDGDEDLVRHAYDRGIRYFDTAEGYTFGRSEKTLGAALHDVRDRVVIASKQKGGASEKRGSMMEELEGSLRSLRTDYIDVYFNHAVNDVARLANPEWPEFVARAKQQGKIRFTGMSGHGGHLVQCIDYALEHDLADVLLVGYNFGQDPSFMQRFTAGLDFVAVQPELPAALARAKRKNVGVVAMKTLRGARLNDLRPYETGGATYAQAAFRWVLSSPNTDALIVTMRSTEQVDEYVGGSGWTPPSAEDVSLLRRYEERNGATQCRYGCSGCVDACPAGVPIADVLRTRMYAEDYADLDLARSDYAGLGAGAEACASCDHRSCTGACPHGIDISALTTPLHARLADTGAGR
jgi:predicted aldo/keto reductase-like oxidoreductase